MSESLKKILKSNLENLMLLELLPEKLAMFYWDEVLENELENQTQAQKVSRGVLIVGVNSVTLRNRLTLKKAVYLEKLNQKLSSGGGRLLTDLKFTHQAGRIAPKKTLPPPVPLDPMPWLSVKLDEEDKKEVNRLASRLKEAKLRKKFRSFLIKERQYKKYLGQTSGFKGEEKPSLKTTRKPSKVI